MKMLFLMGAFKYTGLSLTLLSFMKDQGSRPREFAYPITDDKPMLPSADILSTKLQWKGPHKSIRITLFALIKAFKGA